MKKTIYIIISVLLLSYTAIAQQNNSMYFMKALPQSRWLNPANEQECKVHVGGFLIPIIGQSVLPMQFNYANNGFAFNDILQHNKTVDSLTLPGLKYYDWNQLLDGLQEVNYITSEFHINLLTIGFQYKKWSFGIDINDKTDTRFSFNKDLVILAKEGNGQSLLNKTAHLGDLGMTATSYTELALTASRDIIDKKLRVGAAVKLLFGRMNVWTERSVIDLYTNDNDNYPITVDADVLVHMSQPFFTVDKMYYDNEADSIVMESHNNEVTITKALFNPKNFGLGVDLGAVYTLNDKFEFSASLTDLAYIKWVVNPQTFAVKGTYFYDGYNFQPSLTGDKELIAQNNDSLKGSVINVFYPSLQSESYTSFLTPKLYLGGTFTITEKIRTGALLRVAFFQHDYHPSLTLSGNFRISKWLETVASYSMMHNSYTNIGLGFAIKGKWFQTYMITDNIFGSIWPQSTRNVNLRMGLNLIFGCKKKEDSQSKQ